MISKEKLVITSPISHGYMAISHILYPFVMIIKDVTTIIELIAIFVTVMFFRAFFIEYHLLNRLRWTIFQVKSPTKNLYFRKLIKR